eukprot:CAMPEP_0170817134 /NCGR_PEP_ID=MMETSP0733-20121128/39811_1 /TAXON_ID=186038 /ORGANISM="Fragilariopsis kerguelensis, Strain L26-C5" /LENGTH=42 /DNA_ID= /DNA_START= /DNA_END= /DNA_ORIENTATION=
MTPTMLDPMQAMTLGGTGSPSSIQPKRAVKRGPQYTTVVASP